MTVHYLEWIKTASDSAVLYVNMRRRVSKLAFLLGTAALVARKLSTHFQSQPVGILSWPRHLSAHSATRTTTRTQHFWCNLYNTTYTYTHLNCSRYRYLYFTEIIFAVLGTNQTINICQTACLLMLSCKKQTINWLHYKVRMILQQKKINKISELQFNDQQSARDINSAYPKNGNIYCIHCSRVIFL